DEAADGGEALADLRQQRLVDLFQLTRGRDLPDVLGDHRGGAVDEVAPAGDQLVVGAGDEVDPGEVGVVVLGAGGGDEVAQRVGLVALEHVAHIDDHTLGGGEL